MIWLQSPSGCGDGGDGWRACGACCLLQVGNFSQGANVSYNASEIKTWKNRNQNAGKKLFDRCLGPQQSRKMRIIR